MRVLKQGERTTFRQVCDGSIRRSLMRLWLFVGLVFAGLTGGGLVLAAALPPATIEAAVVATLRAAGAPPDGVQVTNARCMAARETCLSYIADVVVRGRDLPGRLACRGPWESCTLWLDAAGVRDHGEGVADRRSPVGRGSRLACDP